MAGKEGVFSLAGKLDRLFRATDRPEPSYMAVAEAIRAAQGVPISHTYIWQLRTGRRDNPTVQHLTALATYFGVPVAFFLDDETTARVDGQLELLRTLRDAGVTEMALRAADVSPDGRAAISELIRQVWESEHPRDTG
ncbi:helix-turn-helix domain-containing protein [Actinoplanes sp. GCM10030250]|uniref:helix-turn-helix domain-containing protein n=1 Tax=Actinoplanes sp. GCM10030250 TaxID=3273376 RepID=UPI0036093846